MRSSGFVPAAMASTTTYTGRREPRMHGCPSISSGSTTTRSTVFTVQSYHRGFPGVAQETWTQGTVREGSLDNEQLGPQLSLRCRCSSHRERARAPARTRYPGWPGHPATATCGRGSVRYSDSRQHRRPVRPRIPDTAPGHGPRCRRRSRTELLRSTDGFPDHGPRSRPLSEASNAAEHAALRASAPARRPAVACGVHFPRSVSATSGRLDGLLGGCDALARRAIPGGAPHGIVPIETRTPAAQYRVPHARRCATSRAQRGP
jgi:hypothetical protein